MRTASPVDSHVGTRIRMRRAELGMNQERLATALAVSSRQVQNYEKGVNRIGAGHLQHIADVLKVPVTFFFQDAPAQGHGEPFAGVSPLAEFDVLNTGDGAALATAFMQLKCSKLRRRVVALVEQLADGESVN